MQRLLFEHYLNNEKIQEYFINNYPSVHHLYSDDLSDEDMDLGDRHKFKESSTIHWPCKFRKVA